MNDIDTARELAKEVKRYIDKVEGPNAPKMVYVAGPYRHPDPCENTKRAMDIATIMLDSGLVVPILPHLTHYWHSCQPRKEEVWLTLDMHQLARCDGLYRIPGKSRGADIEVGVAEHLGMPIFMPGPTQYQKFMAWVRDEDK